MTRLLWLPNLSIDLLWEGSVDHDNKQVTLDWHQDMHYTLAMALLHHGGFTQPPARKKDTGYRIGFSGLAQHHPSIHAFSEEPMGLSV